MNIKRFTHNGKTILEFEEDGFKIIGEFGNYKFTKEGLVYNKKD